MSCGSTPAAESFSSYFMFGQSLIQTNKQKNVFMQVAESTNARRSGAGLRSEPRTIMEIQGPANKLAACVLFRAKWVLFFFLS